MMRLGLLSDIHEANDLLRAALTRLAGWGAERLIVLGDLFETGRHIRETIALLSDAGAAGVWGNHDLGLTVDPVPHLRERYGPAILDYCATLRGTLEVADCLVTHAQAWMDPADVEQPWYWHGLPEEPELLARNFAATNARVLFQGHYHRWLAATPAGPLPWRGEGPLRLDAGGRYLIVVHAVCAGWCAGYDTESGELVPFRL